LLDKALPDFYLSLWLTGLILYLLNKIAFPSFSGGLLSLGVLDDSFQNAGKREGFLIYQVTSKI